MSTLLPVEEAFLKMLVLIINDIRNYNPEIDAICDLESCLSYPIDQSACEAYVGECTGSLIESL